jgi:hypothetical protein
MINTTAVSLIMADMQGIFIEAIQREGYSYPLLIVINEETSINISKLLSKYECILAIDYSDKQYDVFVTLVTFRNRDDKDDQAIIDATKEIALHQPNAMGYISQCLYKSMSQEDNMKLTTERMNLESDTIRILHNCFFIKDGDPFGYRMITPYKVKDQKNHGKNDFVFEEPAFSVLTFNKGWEPASPTLVTRIPNPYSHGGIL